MAQVDVIERRKICSFARSVFAFSAPHPHEPATPTKRSGRVLARRASVFLAPRATTGSQHHYYNVLYSTSYRSTWTSYCSHGEDDKVQARAMDCNRDSHKPEGRIGSWWQRFNL